jgi:hypothetical protein
MLPANLAQKGVAAAMSHLATERYVVNWNMAIFVPARRMSASLTWKAGLAQYLVPCDMNKSAPVVAMVAKAAQVAGRSRFATRETDRPWNARPKRRRSNAEMLPTKTTMAVSWTASRTGKSHEDSTIAFARDVDSADWQNNVTPIIRFLSSCKAAHRVRRCCFGNRR